jgi:large subunit ribosomal protein L9
MKVILKETISSLGIIGSEVSVANGFARNYLFPQGKAVEATKANRKIMERNKAKFELQFAKEKELATQMAERIAGVECEIKAKVSDEDRLYGSVSLRDILKALADMDIKIEKRMVMLAEPIKTLGTFKVPIRVYQDVEPEITVNVVPAK